MEIKNLEDLQKLLKKTRKESGVTQTQLADFSNLQRVGISKIENGETDPKFSTVLKIADLLGLEIHLKPRGQ